MDKLINKCRRLLALVNTDVVRELMQQINWDQRLISIRGARGVGKTTLMLQYLKLNGCDCKRSLYISMDSVYFATHTLKKGKISRLGIFHLMLITELPDKIGNLFNVLNRFQPKMFSLLNRFWAKVFNALNKSSFSPKSKRK